MTKLEYIYRKVKDTPDFVDAVDFLAAPPDIEDESGDISYALSLFTNEHMGFRGGSGFSKVALVRDNDTAFRYALKTNRKDFYYNSSLSTSRRTEDDECETEYRVYKAAKEAGLDYFFAETISLENGVFLQEAYKETLTWSTDDHIDSLDRLLASYIHDDDALYRWAEAHCQSKGFNELFELICEDAVILAFLVSMYSEEELMRLQEFLEKYCINDLHSSNIGWFGNRLKFIDYSGYGSDTSEILSEEGY